MKIISPGNIGKQMFIMLVLLLAAIYFIWQNMFRPLWFDEALTILEFVSRDSIAGIYNSYWIPNNHIVFNILLGIWMSLYEYVGEITDFSFRLFTITSSIILLVSMLLIFARSAGIYASLLVTFAFVCSSAFEIYSVAIRGYMLSFLVLVFAIHFFKRAFRNPGIFRYICCLTVSLILVGIMPSNIIPLTAVLLIFIPFERPARLFRLSSLIIMLIPFVSLVIFYLPIMQKFLAIFSLKEGWEKSSDVIICVYMSFITGLLPLLVMALAGAVIYLKDKKFSLYAFRMHIRALLVFSIPLFMISFMSTPPFPRLLFPLWAVWLFFCAIAVRPLMLKINKLPFRKSVYVLVLLILSIAGWCVVQNICKDDFSKRFTARGALDDYFRPYYMRNFDPLKTVLEISKLYESSGKNMYVYVTFNADPYSIEFYSRLIDLPQGLILYDGPRRTIAAQNQQNGTFLIIATGPDDLERAELRLGIKNLRFVKDCGFQKIYQAEFLKKTVLQL